MSQIQEVKKTINDAETHAKIKAFNKKTKAVSLETYNKEFAKLILEWHTSELNRKMEEVLKKAEEKSSKLSFLHGKEVAVLQTINMEDLKSLLNEKKNDTNP